MLPCSKPVISGTKLSSEEKDKCSQEMGFLFIKWSLSRILFFSLDNRMSYVSSNSSIHLVVNSTIKPHPSFAAVIPSLSVPKWGGKKKQACNCQADFHWIKTIFMMRDARRALSQLRNSFPEPEAASLT